MTVTKKVRSQLLSCAEHAQHHKVLSCHMQAECERRFAACEPQPRCVAQTSAEAYIHVLLQSWGWCRQGSDPTHLQAYFRAYSHYVVEPETP